MNLRICLPPRSFAKPPQAVQDISECIVVMRGYKDISWKTAKGMMAEGNFLKTLQVGGANNFVAITFPSQRFGCHRLPSCELFLTIEHS